MSELPLVSIRSEEDRLAAVERAAAILDRAASPAEAKKVADLAAAADKYGRLQRADKEQLARSRALRVDALARMGELLAGAELSTGARGVGPIAVPGGNCAESREKPPTLEDMGISKKESMYAQALAVVKRENPDLYRSIRESGKVKEAHEWLKQREREDDGDEGEDQEGDPRAEDADWFDRGRSQFAEAVAHLLKAQALFDELLRGRAGRFLARGIVAGEGLFAFAPVDVRTRAGRRVKKVWRSARLAALIAAAKRTAPDRVCAGCRGGPTGCTACKLSGFIPRDESLLKAEAQRSLDLGGEWEEGE